MIKMMAAIRRKPGMTMQEFFPYIRDVHGAISKVMPLTVRRYVQSHVFDAPSVLPVTRATRLCFTATR